MSTECRRVRRVLEPTHVQPVYVTQVPSQYQPDTHCPDEYPWLSQVYMQPTDDVPASTSVLPASAPDEHPSWVTQVPSQYQPATH